jgi:hypothetical protein
MLYQKKQLKSQYLNQECFAAKVKKNSEERTGLLNIEEDNKEEKERKRTINRLSQPQH